MDLGAARIDFLDGQCWVHEVKSSTRPTEADHAQGRHYCHRLHTLGIPVEGTVLHYPATRRTQRHPYTDDEARQAAADIAAVLAVAAASTSPDRLPRPQCRGCSYTDYCWTE
ncbi:Dna2/Cas4 domain-containing protein [Wenjunlia tyrosinilytica]|uniref:DUF83 domain-containing protein n=1 Tax=Wenjunlia tyrosinilytica TaxID=1544741 RepID=A0A918E047_9ACTN|nr:Dna2/Cas4 domain-containing protein [Wenjunlia tyrosinilytica]GGO95982.1 hypothetical protein GCM10012280_54440 [Wenjunlia tyrosinilytica]